jgi:tetratricopeptide (TPR) repeat protein
MPMASSEPAAASVGQESVESAAQVASTPEADAAAPQWPEASGADAAADNQSASPASGAGGSNGDALQRARNAYWAGDLDGALAAYKQAAAAHPDDPDVQGELGNIHFAQGNWEPAAAAYLAAGRALLHRGDQAAAEHLVVVLQGLNPEHARSLADELAQQSEGGRQ